MSPGEQAEQLAIVARGAHFSPGDTVSGVVEARATVRGGSLKLALEYRDWTPDYHAVTRTVELDAPLAQGELTEGSVYDFAIAIPPDALPNQSGRVGRTTWGLHARVVRSGPDAHAWQELEVSWARRPSAEGASSGPYDEAGSGETQRGRPDAGPG